jgi:hypothetical protein
VDNEIGLGVVGNRLGGEIAMHAQSGGFHDTAQGCFSPAAPSLIGTEDAPQLHGFGGKSMALFSECFQVLPNLTERRRLAEFALLEVPLIRLELLLQGFEERGDGLLPLRQVAFRCLVKLGQRLIGQSKKLRLRLL